MTRSDSVHSTPPLNTPIDTNRRRFLTVAAGASVASVGTLAVAAMPAAAPDSAACAVDPIFAMIGHHRELSAHYDAAVSISASMAMDDPAFEDADGQTDQAQRALIEHANSLIRTEPTTLAGVIALTDYLATIEEWEEPVVQRDMLGEENGVQWRRAAMTTIVRSLAKISALEG